MTFIKSLFRIIKLVIFLILLTCLVIFMVNNRQTVTIELFPLPFEIETKVFLVMILTFLLGTLFGFLLYSQSLIIKTISNIKDRRRIKKLEKKSQKIKEPT
jgi:uncharacterized integral membrane protein